jgi:cytochrome c oxidase cbb3-type subunit III
LRFVFLFLVLIACGCEREQRQYQIPAAAAKSPSPERTRHEENAYSVAQGKTLFRWFNCNGCHASGGGGMGPALMDAEWRYGSETESVFETIMNGRPNGMPAFRGRITEDQAWQLVAYVRSMSGLLSMDVAPGRNDGISAVTPENLRDSDEK